MLNKNLLFIYNTYMLKILINYELTLQIVDIISACMFIFAASIAWYYIGYFVISFKKNKAVPHSEKKTHFAILVPARNESNVIDHILFSLKRQRYDENFYDVWIIVQDENDPTIEIVKRYGKNFHTFIRPLPIGNRCTKGYALQDCINYFYENNLNYDAYMIFDADNVMEKDFLSKMNDLRQTGVQVGVGYRNFTNATQNWLTCCSATLFSYINNFTSKGRSILFKKATLSGTGYYIDADIIKDAGGWIFTGMTEDVEVTTYCYYHNVNMRYYPNAVYYDEQSSKLKIVHNQHIRWVWGYFGDRHFLKKREPNYKSVSEKRLQTAIYDWNVSIFPFIALVATNLCLAIFTLVMTIVAAFKDHNYLSTFFWHFGIQMIVLYGLFVFVALITILKDNKNLKFNLPTILWTALTYGLFFFDFVTAFLDGLIHKKKRTIWKPIAHNGEIIDKRAKAQIKNKKK